MTALDCIRQAPAGLLLGFSFAAGCCVSIAVAPVAGRQRALRETRRMQQRRAGRR